ncbi:rhomboid family intramembrane serine protease [Opitutaceae bacterium]|nr:rhomboid family intramembrane serine protease [Opitutaceae bacterium]
MGTANSQNEITEGGDFVVIGTYKSVRLAHEAGLAILAAGHHYWVYPVEDLYALAVLPKHAETLRREVDIAQLKNRFWPPVSIDLPNQSTRKAPTVIFAMSLLGMFTAQNAIPGLKDLGMNSSEGVFQNGEWWRIVTAITLHADLAHLAGNLLGIALFTYLCCRYMGNGLAWFLIVLVASFANLTNAYIRLGEPFFSLGASTAVFAALGLLAGFPVGTFLKTRDPMQNRDWLIPFFGGCILFAWMGGGEFPTDVMGHVLSFVFGTVVAIGIAWTGLHSKLNALYQKLLLLITWVLLIASWAMAVQ